MFLRRKFLKLLLASWGVDREREIHLTCNKRQLGFVASKLLLQNFAPNTREIPSSQKSEVCSLQLLMRH